MAPFSRLVSGLVSGALVAAAVAAARPAAAQEPDVATLVAEAKQLIDTANYERGCPKLQAANERQPAVDTLVALADCYFRWGKSASAWARLREAAGLAARTGDGGRAQELQLRADKLEPTLARLSVIVHEPVPAGLVVTLDGEPIELLGSFVAPTPIDPGPHTIAARAPGRTTMKTTLELRLGSGTTTFEIDAAGSSAPAIAEHGDVQAAGAAAAAAPAPAAGWSGQQVVGVGLGALGLTSITASLVGGLLAKSENDRSNEDGRCIDGFCTQAGIDRRVNARDIAEVATALFIGGAALAGAGIVLLLTGAPSSSGAPAPKPRAALGLGPGSLSLTRSW